MGDFDPAFVHSLAVQSWSLYSIGMLLIFLRLHARIHRLGIRGLQTDDYLMMLAGGLYTALVVCLNVISGGGGSNLYLPSEFDTFTPEDIQERIKGSKIVLISEQAMLNVIYTIKACMLIMYSRLTLGLTAQRLVFYLAIYVACGWVATEIAFFTACTPFSGYYAMPPPDPQCTTLQHYAIVQACFNISSDTLMLFIPLPLITRLAVPLKQKCILLIIFSMGTFVIIAAILTKYFNLSNIWDPSYMMWYTRESSVAVYVSNLPMIWPLILEWIPSLRIATTRTSERNRGQSYGNGGTIGSVGMRKSFGGGFGGKRLSEHGIVTTIRGKGESTEELSSGNESQGEFTISMPSRESGRASWEEQRPVTEHEKGLERGESGWISEDMKGGIHLSTTVKVTEEYVDERGIVSPVFGHDVVEKDSESGGSGRFQWKFER